jgi:hypothetical protein
MWNVSGREAAAPAVVENDLAAHILGFEDVFLD